MSGLNTREYVATEQVVYSLKETSSLDTRGVLFAVQWFCDHYVKPSLTRPMLRVVKES